MDSESQDQESICNRAIEQATAQLMQQYSTAHTVFVTADTTCTHTWIEHGERRIVCPVDVTKIKS